MRQKIISIVAMLFGLASSASYLFWMPFISKSMKITFMPIAEELAKRGHEVTVVMPYPSKKQIKGVKEIVFKDSPYDKITMQISKTSLQEGSSLLLPVFDMIDAAVEASDKALAHPDMAKLIKNNNTKFDVVMVSEFLANEAGYYIAHRFNAELCLYFTGQGSMPFMNHAMGQPHNTAYVPMLVFSFQHPMSFLQRAMNTVGTYFFHYYVRNRVILNSIDTMLDKHFPGEKRPALLDIERNASLAMSFGHPLLMDGLRPIAPNFVYVGMMNCREPEPLSKDLQDFMESGSEHGVILVSLGSVLKASEMAPSVRKIFTNVFSRLKQKVIWKWETEDMEDKPDNLELSKWLPQQDLLAHPNTKMFLTHGGQSSFQETLCYKKPVVVTPVKGDQPANAEEAVRIGIGKSIMFSALTEENLYEAITEVLENDKYTKKAEEYGSLLLDQETKPLDRAIWWLEYISRRPGDHFRSPVHDLSFAQFYLLDVFAFLVLLAVLWLVVSVKICQYGLERVKKTYFEPKNAAQKKVN